MTLDWAAIRDSYNKEYPAYKDLAEKVAGVVRRELEAAHLHCHVEGRPKEALSLVVKAFRKHSEQPDKYADPLAAIGDKAGVRVIVDDLDAREVVHRTLDSCLAVLSFEDTAERYQPHELGYLGQHYQVRLLDTDLSAEESYLRGLECEVQVHTRAQNAWSTVSHPLLYKPAGREPSQLVTRRVMRAIALVSLFDEQVEEARREIMTDPNYRPAFMLSVLKRQFFNWLRSEPDDELSLAVLEVVQRAYTADELRDFESKMDEFVRAHRRTIDGVMQAYVEGGSYNPLLFQPEAIAVYERLKSAPTQLKAAWVASPLPLEPLDLLGEAFAVAVP